MLAEVNNIEYWKKEYLEISKDNDKLEQEIQQYKQQIDELKLRETTLIHIAKKLYKKEELGDGIINSMIGFGIIDLSKLKERNEE